MVDFFAKDWSENDVLLTDAKNGCVRAINEVLSRSRGHIFLLVKRPLGKWDNVIDPEDVVQDIQYCVFRDLQKCNATTWNEFRFFLMTVSRNKTLHSIEKCQAKKRGGAISIFNLEHRSGGVALQSSDFFESNSLDELIAKLESITKQNADNQAVLESYVESIDRPKRETIALAERKTGKTRQQTYAAMKRFKSDARAVLECRHDPELVQAVRDDLRTGQCRRSMRSCYGLRQSELDAIEVDR